MVLTTTLSTDCRRTKARDEVLAASLIDSSSVYLPVALNDINSVLNDPTADPALKSSLWMIKGQVSEMLGLPDSAVASYDTIVASYHQYTDSVFALWRLQHLAIPTDTSTISNDSATFALGQREYTDLVAMVDTIPPPPPPPPVAAPQQPTDTGRTALLNTMYTAATAASLDSVASQTDGVQHIAADTGLDVTVHPNPAGNTTRICVADLPGGVPAVVEVVNEEGTTVATLYNATPDAELGLCLTLDCSKLPSGTYFAHIANSIMGRAVRISIQH